MSCENVRELIRDYLDRELEPTGAVGVEDHLAACSACAERAQAERDLKLAIRTRVRPGPSPAGLAATIARAVRAEAAAGPMERARGGARRRQRTSARRLLSGVAAALLVSGALVAAWMGGWRPGSHEGPPPASRLTVELVDDHIRYLGAEEASELATADPGEAERWFRSRVDVAIELPRFGEEAATLGGGRLCYVLDRRVALLFYRREAAPMSLFVMSASGLDFEGMGLVDLAHAEACATQSYKGYQVVSWKRRGLLYALVADEHADGLVRMVADAYQSD